MMLVVILLTFTNILTASALAWAVFALRDADDEELNQRHRADYWAAEYHRVTDVPRNALGQFSKRDATE